MVDDVELKSSSCPLRYCVRSLAKHVEENEPTLEAKENT